MKKTLGKQLIESVREARAVARGERPPSRAWKVTKRADGSFERVLLDPKKIQARNKEAYDKRQIVAAREALGLSQAKFADLLGVSIDTLQNWEQGRRVPTGAARVLLRVAAANPKAVLAAAA
jgi:putative transcriptional regulator